MCRRADVDLPADLLALIIVRLGGDTLGLSRMSRSCGPWHAVCLPVVHRTIDLSCRNIGRLPELESPGFPNMRRIETDFADKYRPRDILVARQRTFLSS